MRYVVSWPLECGKGSGCHMKELVMKKSKKEKEEKEKAGNRYFEKTVVGQQDPQSLSWGQIPVTCRTSSGLH